MINTNNLQEGQIINNYKELCSILEIKATSGNGKVKQMEELSLYVNFHKEGYKIIIDKIIETPVITLDDILKNKNNKYITLVANIILEYLYNEPSELKEIPLLRFMELLGLTNTNYKNGGRYKKELSQLYDIKIFSIYYFYSNTKNQFKQLIERCLNNLQKRSILFWTKCIMIVDKKERKYKKYFLNCIIAIYSLFCFVSLDLVNHIRYNILILSLQTFCISFLFLFDSLLLIL